MRRDAAEKMLAKIDGYGLDNLILHAEIAPPRDERPRRTDGDNEGGDSRGGYSGAGERDFAVARNMPWRK